MIRLLVPFPEHGGPYVLEIDGRKSSIHRATVQGGKTGCGCYTEHNWLPWDTDREKVGIAARALYRLMAGDFSIEQHKFAIGLRRAGGAQVKLLDRYPPMAWWSEESRADYVRAVERIEKEVEECFQHIACLRERVARPPTPETALGGLFQQDLDERVAG